MHNGFSPHEELMWNTRFHRNFSEKKQDFPGNQDKCHACLQTYIVEDALVVVGPGHAGELDLFQDVWEVFRGGGLLELNTKQSRDHKHTRAAVLSNDSLPVQKQGHKKIKT